jgi:predicted transposase YdaD
MARGPRSRGDEGWKMVLESYFPDFLLFFFPEIYHAIEPGCYEFVDSELQSLSRRVGTGKRITDKLVKVALRSGEETWLLIHIEVQGEKEPSFEERLFIYSYRIYDRHRRDVVTLAVLADDQESYRPRSFEMGRWGCRHRMEFPSVKLLDYRDRMEELETSRNPFAVVVLAHLRHLETKTDKNAKLFWKSTLVKSLDEKGFTKDDRNNLYIFIDWLMALPEELEIEFNEDMKRYEEEKNMAYVTSAERLGRKKGREEGREEGREVGRAEEKLSMAKKLIAEGLERERIKRITCLSDEDLDKL